MTTYIFPAPSNCLAPGTRRFEDYHPRRPTDRTGRWWQVRSSKLRRIPDDLIRATHVPCFTLLSFFLVAIPERPHPFPSRTRKLSSPGPMVLQGQLCGRVGRRRGLFHGSARTTGPRGEPAISRSRARVLFGHRVGPGVPGIRRRSWGRALGHGTGTGPGHRSLAPSRAGTDQGLGDSRTPR